MKNCGRHKLPKRHKLLRNLTVRNLKSQAALEFLTTYGWAFLVILIMISTLAYFGILKPSRLLPDRCSIGPEFECQDFQLAFGTDGTDGTVKLRLKNNVGEAISVSSMKVSAESAIALTCTAPPDISGVWGAGTIKDFTFTNCNSVEVGFIPGEKGKAFISIKYNSVRSGVGYVHDVNGEIFASVI